MSKIDELVVSVSVESAVKAVGGRRMQLSLLAVKKTLVCLLSVVMMVLSAPSMGDALPKEGGGVFDAKVGGSGAVMEITGTNVNENNVLNWLTFDIDNGESVKFNGAQNYLNLIHDNAASRIDGNLVGNAANVYLINPNGVLFGAGSSVNVGNLYVSARPVNGECFVDYVNKDGSLINTDAVRGDIIYLGSMQATKAVLEGRTVTLTDNIDNDVTYVFSNIGISNLIRDNAQSAFRNEQLVQDAMRLPKKRNVIEVKGAKGQISTEIYSDCIVHREDAEQE